MKREDLVRAVNEIIAQYAGMRLTLRQIYYRLVAAQVLENRQSAYKGLSSVLVDARKSGDVSFNAIEDRTRAVHDGHGTDRPADDHFRMYWDYVAHMDDRYTMPRWWDQPKRVHVWLEKQALQALFEQVTNAEGVDLAVCRGYPSLTFLWEASELLLGLNGQKVEILYFGDYDPSGKDIERYVRETLVEEFGVDANVHRVAITRDQIEEYEIPPAPAKTTDARYEGFVATEGVAWQVELDAIEPRALQGLIRGAVRGHWDASAGRRREEELAGRRERIREWLDDALNPDFEPPEADT